GLTFTVTRGLPVYMLSDSMCRGVEEHILISRRHTSTPALSSGGAWSSTPGDSTEVTREALVVVHIGTNDVASGLSPAAIVDRWRPLIDRIQRLSMWPSAHCPRAVDNEWNAAYSARDQPRLLATISWHFCKHS
ncbi:hypothetical protein KUCAC02_022159, partial [Chaenocephalus aceratus]